MEKQESTTPNPVDVIRAALELKKAKIEALESTLPTLGAGLIAQAVVHYLLALNEDFFATCRALADAASHALAAQSDEPSATEAGAVQA
jgi:hypothetical protein